MKSKVGTVESLGCLHLFDSSVAILAQARFLEVPLPALDPILVMRTVSFVPWMRCGSVWMAYSTLLLLVRL